MRIVFDEPKRNWTLEERGLDFAELDVEFFLSAKVVAGNKPNRFKAIGRFLNDVVVVVFSPLGSEAISVVSMRRASRKERKGFP